MTPTSGVSSAALRYLFNHIILPPRLPQADDRDSSKERQLLEVTLLALQDLQQNVNNGHVKTVKSAVATIENLRDSRDDSGNLTTDRTKTVFTKLSQNRSGDYAPLEIKSQNAAVIVSRFEEGVKFEFFELSPTNVAVMQTKGRLTRHFPALAAKVASSDMQNAAVVSSLAHTIATLAVQKALGMQPEVSKNKKMLEEDRDTTKPDMVTDWFLHQVAAIGETVHTERITKSTREDILWNNCLSPWRRSPLWLLVRVSLHLLFTRCAKDTDHSDSLYKAFMIHVLLRLLSMARSDSSFSGNESIYIINAKLLRRLRKFEQLKQAQCLHQSWFNRLRVTVQSSHKVLESCWKKCAAHAPPPMDVEALRQLRPEDDLDTDLAELDVFLSQARSRQVNPILPSFDPGPRYPIYSAHTLPSLSYEPGECKQSRLAALEWWVEHHLTSWIALQALDIDTCGKLRQLMKNFFAKAGEIYDGVPISLSIMYLTLLELWVACDKSACNLYPMLKNYNHELLLDECQCLVLPLKSQMVRLAKVEDYVQSRSTAAIWRSTSIFRDFGHPQSFSVVYYDQCQELQELHARIVCDASEKWKQKQHELARVQREYKELMDAYRDPCTKCDTYEQVCDVYNRYTRPIHSPSCKKCALLDQANSLSIDIYEWPLSPELQKAKSTVFELKVPQAYSDWRDSSAFMISDVLGFRDNMSGRPSYEGTLSNHHGLSEMLPREYFNRRIVPISIVKSHTTTHRRQKTGVQHLSHSDVCLKNALRYEYYDTSLGVCNAIVRSTQSIPKKCLYTMPDRSRALDHFMYKPPNTIDGPVPNDIMANLPDCPLHFSIDEFKAFGALPFGHKIIYSSILTQLAMPAIDFAKAEVQTLILQIIHQTGPTLDKYVERASHHVLKVGLLGHAIIVQLESAIERVVENWESWRAIASFVRLAQRVLSMTSFPNVQEHSLTFLDRARKVCLKWLLRLKERIVLSTDEAQRVELRSRMAEIALVCASTCDIEQELVEALLLQPSTISSLLQSSIVVQENIETIQTDDANLLKISLHAWRSMMYRISRPLLVSILQNSTGINEALIANWADFQPTALAQWAVFNDTDRQWIHINSGALPVHFNILTAELLVNGLPLARLPYNYMKHTMYKPLFHGSSLEVVPTSEPGLNFSTKSTYHGFKLNFGMSTSRDMLVVAIANQTRWDLVPPRLLEDQFPVAFVIEYLHWYNHETGEVLFRPREDPWPTSEDVWRLKRVGLLWRLVKDDSTVVNMASRTAKLLLKMFSRVEEREHVHIVFNVVTHAVKIILPRLQLDFIHYRNDYNIHACQYRDMVLDKDQSIGTLVGLSSMLVLKCTRQIQDRLVLIPTPCKSELAAISYTKDVGLQHVKVAIGKFPAGKMHAYALDATIGRIVDSGSLHSKLLLAYLHALTSHCLPDPFTGYTGTESALNILRSAAARSYDRLGPDNIALLRKIATLSPLRSFYPTHLVVMQQVKWDENLPVFSQHPHLRLCAYDIMKQAQKMRIFGTTDDLDISSWEVSSEHLEARDSIRTSTYRTCGYRAEGFTRKEDAQYDSRDKCTNSARGRRAYEAASLIIRNQAALSKSIPNLASSMLGSHFNNACVTGYVRDVNISSLRFDTKWMGDLSTTLKDHWCDFHKALSLGSINSNKFDVAAWLSTLAYDVSADMTAIQALAGFYNLQELSGIQIPAASTFYLNQGERFREDEIRSFAQDAVKTFKDSAEARLPRQLRDSNQEHSDRIHQVFQQRCTQAIRTFTSLLENQWPCMNPSTPKTPEVSTYLKVSRAMSKVSAKFEIWYQNGRFLEYLGKVSDVLVGQPIASVATLECALSQATKRRATGDSVRHFSVESIFQISLSSTLSVTVHAPREPDVPVNMQAQDSDKLTMRHRLEKLCEILHTQARSKCETNYVSSLASSCASLELHETTIHELSGTSSNATSICFQKHLTSCEKYLSCLNKALADVVKTKSLTTDQLALLTHHSPRSPAIFWLTQLNRDRFVSLSTAWKRKLIEYGLAITQLHRAQRLAAVSSKPIELTEELRHVGHSNWDPMKYPETLLLEVESKLILRKKQEYIASQMRSPAEDKNIILQVLMGAGKSSTIVPVLVIDFTDQKTLVRVIVAKPQSKQMLQILITRLGGMLNRRVYQMPFSRNVRLSLSNAIQLCKIIQECIENRGVLLVQPEHLLSFKLMGLESLLNGEHVLAEHLLEIQQFFVEKSRDIVDESDLNYSPKLELIYTMGSQQSIEYAPERWLIVQDILGLLPRVAARVKQIHPQGIEIEDYGHGRFPRIRTLNLEAAECLLAHLTKHVVEYGIVGLPTHSQTPKIRAALVRYISEAHLTAVEIHAVEKSKFWTDLTRFPLLLVRGLIAGGVLRFVLSTKRWRVNFSLDSSRVPSTSLAVPYRSKDSPSPRSEFSHPEVVILLSLLSYYYGGLSNEELFDAFGHLSNTDQANIHYDEWVGTATPDLPTAFRHLSGVSIRDRHQCIVELFPSLRYSKKAIDYFLSYLVFPKEMKQFPEKLSGSGWDLGAIKAYPTCGFSGTNDTHHLLPLDMHHLDLPSQNHTNALVLGYLLKDETLVQLLPPRAGGSDADHLLTFISTLDPEVRVMLDCGASILEKNNKQVAQIWLDLRDCEIQAVVFFDDEDLSVLDRNGKVEALQTSPFVKQLDVCIIYLDEAHTRGTDLRLPRDYRAAVTLGARLTKDELTQACMRMRQLGKGQAITFIVPEEITTKIRNCRQMPPSAAIEVNDLLCWSIGETWNDLKRSMPLWAVQGHRYESHKHLFQGPNTTHTQASAFLEDEAQTIEERYGPRANDEDKVWITKDWDMTDESIVRIVTRCREFDAMGFSIAALSEEQERELAPEVEEERQVERPPRMTPEQHELHPDLVRLAQTGKFPEMSTAFGPAFALLASTSAAQLFDLRQLPSDIRATCDYVRTVKPPIGTARASFVSDSYQRPVQWVMSVAERDDTIRCLIIMSPFETNRLLDTIKIYAKVTLHLFAPRFNSSFAPLDQLTLYNVGRLFTPSSVPRSLTVQLNLFAGSLYLRSFSEYEELCGFLGVLQVAAQEGQQVYADGFILPPTSKWGLTVSPVPFLRTLLMKIRREGEGVEKTHVGKILSGVRLKESNFDG